MLVVVVSLGAVAVAVQARAVQADQAVADNAATDKAPAGAKVEMKATTQAGAAAETKPAAGAKAAGEKKFDFNSDKALAGWEVKGAATIDKEKNHGEGAGAALKLGANGTATYKLADKDSAGKVEFWVFDDGANPEDAHANRTGPRWGVMAADGKADAVGMLYTKYVSGADSYAMGNCQGKNWLSAYQHLAVPRATGWHKWTIDVAADGTMKLSFDDQDINDLHAGHFNPVNTATKGFTTLVIYGDTGDGAANTIWVDDLTANITGAVKAAEPAKPAETAKPADKGKEAAPAK
jgi:hypothetical protein